jgi:hypothetical protein
MMAGGDVDAWLISLRDLQRRRRRCAIAMLATARARAHDPSPLLADEPTAHLDYLQVNAQPRRGHPTSACCRWSTLGRVARLVSNGACPVGARAIGLAATEICVAPVAAVR